MNTSKIDALLAIVCPTVTQRLDSAVVKMGGLVAMADMVMAYGDAFDEKSHPRGPDGKFIVGAGASGGIEAYKATLKPGAKGSAAGLVKSMMQAGASLDDILEAGHVAYKSPATSVKWYINDLKKKGVVAGEKPEAEGPKPEAPKPEAPKPEAPKPEAPKPEAPKGSVTAMSASVPGHVKNTIEDVVKNGFPVEAVEDLKPMLENWDKLTQDSKNAVYQKLVELTVPGGLASVTPLPPVSMSAKTFNTALQKAQSAKGIMAPESVYKPTTPVEKKVYEAVKAIPHYRQDHVNYFEDAKGKELKAVLKTNTKNIPGDHYALVTSSYGDDPKNGNVYAVDISMQSYADVMWHEYSSSQRSSLVTYKGSGYSAINKALLKGDKTGASASHITNIRSAISKSHLPADTPAWRGLRASLSQLSGFDDPAKAVGRCFEHKNFASVSRSRKTSEGFGGKTVMRMTLPAGCQALALGGQTPGGEKEIVLPDRGVFRIDKVTAEGNGHLIDVTYLGVREDG